MVIPEPQYKTEEWNGFALGIEKSLSQWENALVKGNQWNFNVIRVVIRASTYDEDKLFDILELIDIHGAKAVIDNHLLSQWVDVDPKFGSQEMRDNWENWVNRWKDDDRIIAWEIANEPFPNVWDNVNVTNDEEVLEEYAIITDIIRDIDPVRPIVWMVKHNIDPNIYLRDNIVASFHPYLYNNHSTWDTIQNILNYRIQQMSETMDKGYSAGWIGEIETKANIDVPLNLGMNYVSEIINYGIENEYGFNYWKYHQTVDDGGGDPDLVIFNSNYEVEQGVIEMVKITNDGIQTLEFKVRKIVVTETPYTVSSGASVVVPVEADEEIVFE